MKKIFFAAVILLLMCWMPRAFAYTVSGADLHDLARTALENALSERGETRRHEIYFTQTPQDVKLPEGTVDVRTELPAQISYISLTPVRVILFVNQRAYRTMNLTANVRVFDNVLVANHDLRIEVPVSAADFHTAEVIIDGRNEYVKDIA